MNENQEKTAENRLFNFEEKPQAAPEMVKKDCFGYQPRTKRCTALTELVCRKHTCSFYKTRQAYMEGLAK